MSTILKALRRLEDDAAAKQSEPQLRDRVVAPSPPQASRSWKRWVLGSAVGFAAALGFGLVVWWGLAQRFGNQSRAGRPLEAEVSAAPIAPVSASAAPLHRALSTAPPPTATAPVVLDLMPPTEAAAPASDPVHGWPETIEIAQPGAIPPPPTGPSQVARELALVAPVPTTQVDQRADEQVPADELAREDAGAIAARSVPITEDVPVPTIVRSRVPDVQVLTTRWHPVRERRQAEVELPEEGRKFTVVEGDRVGPLLVSEITLSGVVFEHDGIEIQRRVGESASVD